MHTVSLGEHEFATMHVRICRHPCCVVHAWSVPQQPAGAGVSMQVMHAVICVSMATWLWAVPHPATAASIGVMPLSLGPAP
jgi:hypothetical protein